MSMNKFLVGCIEQTPIVPSFVYCLVPVFFIQRYTLSIKKILFLTIHCKKELAIFPSPAGMSLTKLSLVGKKLNYSRPGRVCSVTSRLGTGKRPTLFYSVVIYLSNIPRCGASVVSLLNMGIVSKYCINETDVYEYVIIPLATVHVL